RLGAQVVSGIGFLGAGSIISDKEKVRGLTTAAGLWASACIGLALGVGFYFVAVVATMVEMIVLTWVKGWEQKLMPENVQFHLYMETRTTAAAETVIQKIEKMGLKIESVSVEKKKKSEFQKVVLSVHDMGRNKKEEVLRTLGNMEEVRCVKYTTEDLQS
ncbi:MAG: MgtC/SapB family protein, partial [Ruminococcus sp.]|nr:MgtC/SapB family protein [Ruminococcus sp.]